MWEFVEHKVAEPTRWTWARVGTTGLTFQRSPNAYESLGAALNSAMIHGFDGARDPFRLIDLE